MDQKKEKIDMLQGPLIKNLLLFTLPIALGSMLQQLFNAADTSIVGYFGDADALAAVGTNGEIIALIVTLSSGLAIGANVLAASQIGQHREEQIPQIVHTSLLLAGIFGVIGLLIGQCIAAPLLLLIQTPDEIRKAAELYLRIYFLGYPGLLFYDFGSALLRARGDSRYLFFALMLSGAVNVLLNLFFVIVLQLGVTGVAIATDLSTFLSAFLVFYRLKRDRGVFQVSFRKLRIHREYLAAILKLGIPSAVQGAVFCFANIFVQASVNGFGATAIAGSTIAMNFEYFAYYVITAFGQTATTFTSQNHAAQKNDRCRQILWLCLVFSVLSSLMLIAPTVLFRTELSGLFSTERQVTEQACIRIMSILFFEPICGLYEVPAGVLRGMGYSVMPAAATAIGTCAFRILWICTVFQKYHALKILYIAFPISWVITILMVAGCFRILRKKSVL